MAVKGKYSSTVLSTSLALCREMLIGLKLAAPPKVDITKLSPSFSPKVLRAAMLLHTTWLRTHSSSYSVQRFIVASGVWKNRYLDVWINNDFIPTKRDHIQFECIIEPGSELDLYLTHVQRVEDSEYVDLLQGISMIMSDLEVSALDFIHVFPQLKAINLVLPAYRDVAGKGCQTVAIATAPFKARLDAVLGELALNAERRKSLTKKANARYEFKDCNNPRDYLETT